MLIIFFLEKSVDVTMSSEDAAGILNGERQYNIRYSSLAVKYFNPKFKFYCAVSTFVIVMMIIIIAVSVQKTPNPNPEHPGT